MDNGVISYLTEYETHLFTELTEARDRINALEAAIRLHHDSIMDDCVMSETDPGDHDLRLWGNVNIYDGLDVSAAF